MSSNPSVVSIQSNTVTKIATSITKGRVSKFENTDSIFYQTYRLTGQSAPNEATMLAEGIRMFKESDSEDINNSVAIDVYVYSIPYVLGREVSLRVDV